MTQQEFLAKLKKSLRALPQEEIDAAVDYYSEYISDAEGREADVIEKLGAPREVAAMIIASSVTKPPEEGERPKKGLSAAWVVIFAVFAAPVALPVAITVAACALVLVVALFAVLLSFGVAGVGLVVGGVGYVIMGLLITGQDLAMTLFVGGGGLFALGLGIVCLKATVSASRASFSGVARLVGRFILRRSGR
jgi:uncharacterized membrane protein